MLMIEVAEVRLGLARVDQEAGDHRVEVHAREANPERGELAQMRLEVVDFLGRRRLIEQRRGSADEMRIEQKGFRVAGNLELRGADRILAQVQR